MRAVVGVSRTTALDGARWRAAIAIALALAALSGCGGGDDDDTGGAGLPPAGGGGSLVFAVPGLPSTLDPLAADNRAAQTVVRQVYEPLAETLSAPYGQARAQSGLALTAHPSRDRTTWTVTLRPGVRFQDGTPFNAAAVLANSSRWQTDSVGQALLPHLFAVDAPRPDEVRFLLDQPVPDLISRLADPRLGIVSPQALDPESGEGARFLAGSRGSGTGPFQPAQRSDGRLELARSAGWWGSPLGLGPALDGATFLAAPRPSQRLRMVRDGDAQAADELGGATLAAAERDPLLVTVGGPKGGLALEGSVRGIDSADVVPVLSGVWLTRLTG